MDEDWVSLAQPSCPPPAPRRQRLITLDLSAVAQALQQHKVQQAEAAAGAPLPQASPVLRQAWGSPQLTRCISFCRFCTACVAGALHTLAPPALAAAEAAAVLLLYFLTIPNAVPTRCAAWHYSFQGSAEDVVLLSLLRCCAMVAAHALGGGPRFQRPYLWTASVLGAVSLLLALLKLAALRRSQWPQRQWPPFLALYALHAGFAVAQVLSAQRIARWAYKRWESGLAGFGYPWQEGEETWLLAGRLEALALEEGGAAAEATGLDVPAVHLGDPDSRWAECSGLRLHYKLALPPRGRQAVGGSAAVMLLHSFGGGSFSWRHVQQPLADASGLPVVAFDRPGFGLSDRPRLERGLPPDLNPYSLKFQALLTLRLACKLGFERVVLAGHGDGALLALLAAGMALKERARAGLAPSVPGGTAWDHLPQACAGEHAVPATHTVPVRGSAGSSEGHPVPSGCFGSMPLPDSLEAGWMSSLTGNSVGHSLLRRLLKGDWPASIEPRPALHTTPGLASRPPSPSRSPPRPQAVDGHSGSTRRAQRRSADVQPAFEAGQSVGGPRAAALLQFGAPLAETAERSAAAELPRHGEAGGGLRDQRGQEAEGVEAQFLAPDLPPGHGDSAGTDEPTASETAADHDGGHAVDGGAWCTPEPTGLILLHPDLSGCVAPKYATALAHSSLGRRVLRSLLRTEVGEVSNRRAWADSHRLTPQLLELYRRPLRVQGWDEALVEVARARSGIHSMERSQLLACVAAARLPVLVATGEHDRLVPPAAVSRIAGRLRTATPHLAVLPRCGHLSHEEAPEVLLDFLAAFLTDLQQGLRPRHTCALASVV